MSRDITGRRQHWVPVLSFVADRDIHHTGGRGGARIQQVADACLATTVHDVSRHHRVDLTGQLLNQNTFSRIARIGDLETTSPTPAVADEDPSLQVKGPRPDPRRLNKEQVQELAAAYQGGATLKELAAGYGIHWGTVSAHLKRQGVPKRYRVLRWEKEMDEVLKLYGSGMTQVQVAGQLKVNRRTVRKVLLAAGVAIRDGHGNA